MTFDAQRLAASQAFVNLEPRELKRWANEQPARM